MGKTRRFALMLGLSTAICMESGLSLAQSDDDNTEENGRSAAEPGTPEARRVARGASPEDTTARQAERLEKRRERLQQGAKRLRERAAELRKKAANGETAPVPANSKRPPRSFEEQAQRLEDQANKMEERSKNLDAEDGVSSRRVERTGTARQRRHQVRRGQLNRRWGETLRNPDAIAELKVHAERTAKLKRIRIIALKKSKDDPAVERATKLLAKEEARHEKRMRELQGQSAAAAAPAGEAPKNEEEVK